MVRMVRMVRSLADRTFQLWFVLVDCFGSSPTSCFVSVFDGHGGREVVDFVNVQRGGCLRSKLISQFCATP